MTKVQAYSGRIAVYDYIRAAAIIMVVICHSVEAVYVQPYNSLGTASKLFFALTHFIGRLGVPLFLFLTGALILKKSFEKPADVILFYKKNLLPLFFSSEIFIALYYLFLIFTQGQAFRITAYLRYALFIGIVDMPNMWYIPMILGVYLGLPFLGMVLKKTDIKTIMIPLGIVVFYRFLIPTISLVVTIMGHKELAWNIDLNLLGSSYVVYIILGYYITSKGLFSRIKGYVLALLILADIAAGVVFQLWLGNKVMGYYTLWYDSVFVLVAAVCIFLLMYRIKCDSARLNSLISGFARLAFGIYWIHIIVRSLIAPYILRLGMINPLKTCVLTAAVFLISALAVYLMALVKPVGKILFLIRS